LRSEAYLAVRRNDEGPARRQGKRSRWLFFSDLLESSVVKAPQKRRKKMRKKLCVRAGLLLSILLISCAIITVNIYFPEKEVKEAYKALEKELMAPEEKKPEGTPEKKTETPPQSSIRWEWVPSAMAQESELSGKISDAVKKMPDVVAAYKEMGGRLPQIDRLRDSGAVGEGKNGLLAVREEKGVTPADRSLISAENENRGTVMNGMARAIVRINRVPENEQNIRQVMPQAVEQFASVRRSSAKKGWWVQESDGNWSRK
jgi:hypothetical protein